MFTRHRVSVWLTLIAVILGGFRLMAADKTTETAWKKSVTEASAALKKNQLEKASDLYRAAVANAEKLGTNDSRLAETLRQFGSVRLQMSETPDAEAAFRRALALEEKRRGPNDIGLAEILIDLGDVCMFMHRYEEADDYFARAQGIVEQKFGKYDRTVGICLEFRGEAALMDERYPAAETFLKEALELAESPRVKLNFQINQYVSRSVQRPARQQLAGIWDDFGMLYQKTKKLADSEAAFRKSIGFYETEFGKNSLFLCNPLLNSANTFVDEKKYSDAESVLRRCLAILKTGKSDSPVVQTTQAFLKEVLALEKQPLDKR